MKSIALIGTSPIMLILANKLSKDNHNISIYDINPRIGGAWSYYEYDGKRINTQTNVIVPANQHEEEKFNLVNSYLKNEFNINIQEDFGENKPLGYLSKKNYLYDLQILYQTSNKYNLIKKKINTLEIINNKIKINDTIYDEIYIPYFSGIDQLKFKDQIIKIPYNIIVSEHVLIIAKNIKYQNVSYSENFDKYFDRIQIRKYDNFSSFTARVRKEYKGTQLDILIKKSEISKYLEQKLMSKLFKYRNFYRSFEQLEELKKIDKFDQVNIINTFQFFEGFLELKTKYL